MDDLRVPQGMHVTIKDKEVLVHDFEEAAEALKWSADAKARGYKVVWNKAVG